jgi:formylmethanofuran dehydrogenase subunit E
MKKIVIAGKPVEAFMEEIRKFHGWVAPGVLLGGFMVDYALELVGMEVEADAIVETRFCLPDAVQLLTPCTCGNGWLKVLDWDKFALSLYDKKTREGFRIRLDVNKTAAFPNLYNWFMKLVEKKDLPLEVLNQTILQTGREALSADPVYITNYYAKIKKGKTGVCPSCGEAYTLRQGTLCISCQGEGYYQPNENSAAGFLRRAVRY